MTQTELTRRSQVEEIWASRLVYADALNEQRLAAWLERRAAIFERDLPPSNPKPAEIVEPEIAQIPRIRAGKRG